MNDIDHGAIAVAALREAVEKNSAEGVYQNSGALLGIARPGRWAGEIGLLIQKLPHAHRLEIRRAAKEITKIALEEAADPGRSPSGANREFSDRAEIHLGPNVDRVGDEVVVALGALPDLFQRGGRLVRVADDRFIELTSAALVTQMSRAAEFFALRVREDETEWIQVAPPAGLAKSITDAGVYPGVREVQGITHVPQLLADGRVVCTPGFDVATGLWYDGPKIRLVERPTRADAEAALGRIMWVVRHFPWKSPHHRSAWLSLVLTMVMRSLIRGPCPLFVATANQARVGKSRVVRGAIKIATGVTPATCTLQNYTEDEWDKAVSSMVLGSNPDAVLIDNVPRMDNKHRETAVGCATLDAVLSADGPVQIRRFGTSDMPSVLTRTVWAVTTNGAPFRGDTGKRSIIIDLEFNGPSPESRDFGDGPTFEAEVDAQAPQLQADALTIARAWLLAKPAAVSLPKWGTFEAWMVVRQVVVWLGMPDPWLASGSAGGALVERDSGAEDHDRLLALVGAVFGSDPWTAADLAAKVDGIREDGVPLPRGFGIASGWSLGDAQDLLNELGCWDRAGRCVDRKALSFRLRGSKDWPDSGGRRIVAGDRDRVTRNRTWRVESVG